MTFLIDYNLDGYAKGEDSLEQVIREENTANSFPVLTIGNLDRLDEVDYRDRRRGS